MFTFQPEVEAASVFVLIDRDLFSLHMDSIVGNDVVLHCRKGNKRKKKKTLIAERRTYQASRELFFFFNVLPPGPV